MQFFLTRHCQLFALLLLCSSSLLLPACEQEGEEIVRYYIVDVPIYATRAQVQDSIERQAPRELCAPGNIFARGQFLFINEPHVGWHVYDNARPESPTALAFWVLPGSTQLSYAGGRFVTDSYGDILALDVGDDLSISVHSTAENVLAPRTSYDPERLTGLIIGYRRERQELTNFERYYREYECAYCDVSAGGMTSFNDLGNATLQNSGSFSRFAVKNQYLYVVTDYDVTAFIVDDSISATGGRSSGNQLETAFVAGDHLYAGAANGLYIYSLANPAEPEFLSRFTHVQGCDPVAVEGNYAVVTVRDGRNCGSIQNVNRLYVVDISNPALPVERMSRNMRHPHGVALRGNRVYVCEASTGLRVFSFDAERGQLGAELPGSDVPAKDIMLLPYADGLRVMTVSGGGFTQYAVNPGDRLQPVSTLTAKGLLMLKSWSCVGRCLPRRDILGSCTVVCRRSLGQPAVSPLP